MSSKKERYHFKLQGDFNFLGCAFKENEQKIGTVIWDSFHYIKIMALNISQNNQKKVNTASGNSSLTNYQGFPLTFT